MEPFLYWIDGDRLMRYKRDTVGFPHGAILGRDGRWRPTESPDRNLWLGSDYGDQVTPKQAAEFLATHGHDPTLLEGGHLHPVPRWPQADTYINVRVTPADPPPANTSDPDAWEFQVHSITMLGELTQIIQDSICTTSAEPPGRQILSTASRPPSALAILPRPAGRPRWLTDPTQYVIRMSEIYDDTAETAHLHLRATIPGTFNTIPAQIADADTPVPAYSFTGNPAPRDQPRRPDPPW